MIFLLFAIWFPGEVKRIFASKLLPTFCRFYLHFEDFYFARKKKEENVI